MVAPRRDSREPTIAELLSRGRDELGASDSARLDSELLLAAALGSDRTALYRAPDESVGKKPREHYARLITARATGRPIAQILGHAEFWSMRFEVNEFVLIPRPETEQLVELALEHCSDTASVADLGCGSGAVVIALARELPHAALYASDRSDAALAVAGRNAGRLCPGRVCFLRGNWLDPYRSASLDLIVSNPPYVEAGDRALSESDIRFEPVAALAAGPDGLEAIRRLVAGAPRVLRAGGWLLLEHGYNQGTAVRELMRAAGFEQIDTARDLGGRERISSGKMT